MDFYKKNKSNLAKDAFEYYLHLTHINGFIKRIKDISDISGISAGQNSIRLGIIFFKGLPPTHMKSFGSFQSMYQNAKPSKS